MMNKQNGTLFKNTVMLYILTFSNYLFNFITVPYQTRVLGPEIYGTLGFALAFTTYIQLFLDFGFLLSATEEVARNRGDRQKLSRILTAVTECKVILGAASLIVVVILCFSVSRFKEDILLYLLYFIWVLIIAMLPDYLYRGLEKMSIITYRTVAVKFFFTVMIFVLLRSKEQYYAVPILNIIGALGAVIWVYSDVYRRLGLLFTRIPAREVWDSMKRSSSYFFSRIASTVYGATNTFIIGFLYPTGNSLGYYTSAEKLMTTARSAFSPIADSLYPHMVRNKDFKLVKKILLLLMPAILVGCTIVWIWAEPICVWLFGKDYRASGHILQLLMPIIVMTLPTYIFGFPVLSPMGLAKYANISNIIGAVVHAVNLLVLFALSQLTVENICIATCITEVIVLSFRILVVVKNRHRNQQESSSQR